MLTRAEVPQRERVQHLYCADYVEPFIRNSSSKVNKRFKRLHGAAGNRIRNPIQQLLRGSENEARYISFSRLLKWSNDSRSTKLVFIKRVQDFGLVFRIWFRRYELRP